MIKYNLKCECGQNFESWFASSSEYEKLEKKGSLNCVCGKSNNVSKALMSPQVRSKRENVDLNMVDEVMKLIIDKGILR